jgi:hypothetical protein
MIHIEDVPMICRKCQNMCRLGDCVPCIAEDGSDGTGFGCPIEDCGGIACEMEVWTSERKGS